MTRLLPVPSEVPPQEPENHWSVVPEPPVTLRVMVGGGEPVQKAGVLAEALEGATGAVMIFTSRPVTAGPVTSAIDIVSASLLFASSN